MEAPIGDARRRAPEVLPIEALYYPGLEFPSVTWVKAALLYWEGLLRIVPDGVSPNDPAEVKELVEAGVIQNVSPAPFRRATTDAFGPRLEELLRSRAGKPIEDEWAACPNARDGETLVHLTQIEHVLARKLEARHLMSAAGEWARMSPAVARLYQITMANEAARQLFAAPVTDNVGNDVACSYFAFEKMQIDPHLVPPDGLQFAQLYLPFPSQKVVDTISLNRLLEIRSKYQLMRRRFRDTIQHRTAAIATLPSVQAIHAHLDTLAKELVEQLELEREALRASRVRDAWTLLGITAPLTLGSVWAIAGAETILAAAGGFGTVGLGSLGWYLERRLHRRTQGSYLLALGSQVDGNKWSTDLRAGMRRLVGRSK
jgi:hypothetical protein